MLLGITFSLLYPLYPPALRRPSLNKASRFLREAILLQQQQQQQPQQQAQPQQPPAFLCKEFNLIFTFKLSIFLTSCFFLINAEQCIIINPGDRLSIAALCQELLISDSWCIFYVAINFSLVLVKQLKQDRSSSEAAEVTGHVPWVSWLSHRDLAGRRRNISFPPIAYSVASYPIWDIESVWLVKLVFHLETKVFSIQPLTLGFGWGIILIPICWPEYTRSIPKYVVAI